MAHLNLGLQLLALNKLEPGMLEAAVSEVRISCDEITPFWVASYSIFFFPFVKRAQFWT